MFTSSHAKAMARKANRPSHGPRVLANERARKVRDTGNPKEHSTGSSMVKQRFVQGCTFENRSICLENLKSETSSETQVSAQTYHTDNSNTDNS